MNIDWGLFYIGPESGGKRWWNWDWEVAIESENSGNTWDWLEELSRLSHLNAGSKVLLTYIDFQRDTDCRQALTEIRQLCMTRKYRQADERWLFIFGPWWDNVVATQNADYRAYSWDGTPEFIALPPYSILCEFTRL